MELDLFKEELKEAYFKNNSDEELFSNAIKLLNDLYNGNEIIRSLIDFHDIEALMECLSDGYETYKNQFTDCSDTLIELCNNEDYKGLSEYIKGTCSELENVDFSIENSIYDGKINMLMNFYSDVYDHNFKKVFDFVNKCNSIKNLHNIVSIYIEDDNKKNR